MDFKENWVKTDKFTHIQFNILVETLSSICEKYNLDNKFSYEKRNIQVGDDLSGQTIYLNIESNPETEYEWLTTGTAVPIIASETNSIDEGRIYDSGIWRGIAINFDVELGLYGQDFLYLDYEDSSVEDEDEVNLKEFTLADDFGVVTTITTDSSFYSLIQIKALTGIKKIGDFLYIEDLQKIEDTLEIICKYFSLDFEKKTWNTLDLITYEDLNRYALVLKTIENFNTYDEYTAKIYSDLATKTYKEILMEEV